MAPDLLSSREPVRTRESIAALRTGADMIAGRSTVSRRRHGLLKLAHSGAAALYNLIPAAEDYTSWK